jgi:hypothetical protein
MSVSVTGSAGTASAAAILRRGPGRAFIVGALVVAAAVLPHSAFAQFNSFGGAPTGPVVGGNNQSKDGPKPAAPPALPGSRVEKTEPAPAAPGAADLPPTEALFDAINRGDMLAARDAINRGADLNGHNVLGLSPLDLSIDLGRNEITFLLLSLRTPDTGSAPPGAVASASAPPGRRGARGKAAAQTAASGGSGASGAADAPLWPAPGAAMAPPGPVRTSAAGAAPGTGSSDGLTPAQRKAQERAAAREAQRQAVADAQARKAQERADRLAAAAAARTGSGGERQVVSATAPAPATAPRQYAGQHEDSGTPIPQMGFLGFGTVTR